MHRNQAIGRTRRATTEPLEPRLLLSAAQLLEEINPRGATQFANFLSINNTTYFTVNDDPHGAELWKTDGTLAGTTLVKDIEPGPASSTPTFLTNVNGTLFFTARTAASGAELWRSDGTAAGTVMVADISPGPDNGRSGIGGMIALGNQVLFSGSTAPNDGVELWASDGTPAGTRLVKDIAGPNYGSGPADFLRAGNWVYFAATTNETGRELWRTDGTEANTTLVNNVRPFSASSNPRLLGALGNQAVFTADNGTIGDELYVTDDTPAGAHLLKEIRPGSSGPGIEFWAVANNRLFFNAYDGTTLGDELYVTDGTPLGTKLVKDLNPNGGNGGPGYFVPFGDRVFFGANRNDTGRELWASDGTDAGTYLVHDFLPGTNGSQAVPMGVARGGIDALYVWAGDGSGTGNIWKFNSPGATLPILVKGDVDLANSPLVAPAPPANVPEGVVFAADDGSGQQLYLAHTTVPSAQPTRPLLRPSPFGPANADARDFIPFGNRYLFSANDGAHGAELWVTDGTPAGTTLLKDVNPGSDYGVNSLVGAAFNGYFYFNGRTAALGNELWRTDGTPEGTTLFKDLRLGSLGANPGNFAVYNGYLYFTTLLSSGQYELGRTDGVTVTRVANTYSNVPSGYINAVRAIGGYLYIRSEFAGEADLYRFNGTTFVNATANLPYVYDYADAGSGQLYVNAGSRLHKLNPDTATATPLSPDTVSIDALWGTLGPTFYFVARNATTGPELWLSDGTANGTRIVQDLYPGYQSAAPANFFFHTGRLYFTALTPSGWGLWYVYTPGTLPQKVLDLAPATQGSIDADYADLGGDLHFSTTGSLASGKLWRIHFGLPEVVEPDFPHPEAGLLNVNGALLFSLKDATHGSELYRYPALADTQPPAVTESRYLRWNQTFTITLDEDLAAIPAATALQLTDRVTNQTYAPAAVGWNPYTRTLAFDLRALPPGDYRATLPAGAVTDTTGNPLAAAYTQNFLHLPADTNGDRTVDFADLLTLARNYNQSGKTFADGDFNGDGTVNFNDLLLLARSYNTTLPLPPQPAAPVTAAVTSQKPQPSLFSTQPVAPRPKPKPLPSPRRTKWRDLTEKD